MLFKLPTESLLDFLKFLDYFNLSVLQQVNWQLFSFIQQYRDELALKEFSHLEIISENDVRLSNYRRAVDIVNEVEDRYGNGIYDVELNEEQREKLISAAETQIPLYLSEVLPDMSQANDVDSFLIFISRKDVDNVQQPQLCLELPYYPETISDFLYIRFWLFQLSQCYFDSINFSCAVFNPSIVQLLFCHFTEGTDLLGPAIQYHGGNVWLNTGSFINENIEGEHQYTLTFVEKYLKVYKKLNLRVHAYFDVVFPYGPGNLIIDLHNLLVYVRKIEKTFHLKKKRKNMSADCSTSKRTSFSSFQQPLNSCTNTSSDVEQFRINETIRIRESLADLNSKDLRNYFKGVRKLCDELEAKKEDLEVDSIVHQQNLKQMEASLKQLKNNLSSTREKIFNENLLLVNSFNKCNEKIKETAPELSEKLEILRELQQKQSYLKFLKYFVNLRDEIRRCLRKGNYSLLLDNYRKLRKIPKENIEINIETSSTKNSEKELSPNEEPMELVLGEFDKRFNYHFYGDKKTNLPSKPEWFFSQLSCWAENNLEYFEVYLQPFVDEVFSRILGDRLISVCSSSKERRQLSNLIDECVLFEREMLENFGYLEESEIHVISTLCNFDKVLEAWIRLERDTLSAGVDAILADNNAYEPRYKEAADVDPYLVPNFADSFVILMQSMSERYRSILDMKIQCRFLKLQLLIVDEFRSRIVRIGQANNHNCFCTPFPQLLNALWYLTLLLDDWSDSPEFVRLQFFLQQHQQTNARGTFDENASLYRHVWRLWVRNICEQFSELISKKLTLKYSNEKWYDWEGPPKPSEITPSFEPFLRKVKELLEWLSSNISSDSVLTFQHLTNHEIWTALDLCVISQTAFNYRGAAQILYDTTNALIPLLNQCYGKMRGAGVFDKCISVLSTLRLLSLPPPTAILLKDEIKNIPEQQLDSKLEQFDIIGINKAKVLQIFEQRLSMTCNQRIGPFGAVLSITGRFLQWVIVALGEYVVTKL
uniref:F-box domain-containing protein n=1 Tax=Meloidogyne javanica TaxID=6303 RepID=A0A915MSF9_MELJA